MQNLFGRIDRATASLLALAALGCEAGNIGVSRTPGGDPPAPTTPPLDPGAQRPRGDTTPPPAAAPMPPPSMTMPPDGMPMPVPPPPTGMPNPNPNPVPADMSPGVYSLLEQKCF